MAKRSPKTQNNTHLKKTTIYLHLTPEDRANFRILTFQQGTTMTAWIRHKIQVALHGPVKAPPQEAPPGEVSEWDTYPVMKHK